jgi:hypothetical protein
MRDVEDIPHRNLRKICTGRETQYTGAPEGRQLFGRVTGGFRVMIEFGQ